MVSVHLASDKRCLTISACLRAVQQRRVWAEMDLKQKDFKSETFHQRSLGQPDQLSFIFKGNNFLAQTVRCCYLGLDSTAPWKV